MMQVVKRTIQAALLGIAMLSEASLTLAASTRFVCIAPNGALTVRSTKCLSSETNASLANLKQKGAKGATGQAGKGGIRNRRVETFTDRQYIPKGASAYVMAFCASDETVVGGGCSCSVGLCQVAISASGPIPVNQSAGAREGWRCSLTSIQAEVAGLPADYKAYAICVDAE